MDIARNIELFQELVGCGSSIYTWCYDGEGRLLHSNCPEEALFAHAFSLFGCRDEMLRLAADRDAPVALGTALGLVWAAAFEKSEGRLCRAYVIGPMFFSEVSVQSAESGLSYYKETEFSLAWKNRLLALLLDVPVIQNIVFARYALMLHCCVTGQKLSVSDFNFYAAYDPPLAERGEKPRDRHKVWTTEQAMLQMVRSGNLNYKETLSKALLSSNGIPVNGGEPLRQAKDSLIVFISIVCRAAIEGGLSPEVAYSLGDAYIQSVENARSYSELTPVGTTMYDDFVRRVHKRRAAPALSLQVQKCCDYIEAHPDSRIRAKDLARLAGYSEYYLTRKFREETGLSVSDFVKRAKIEQAKLLLQAGEMSIQEIADKLSFSSRSYFCRVYQESTGKTPRQYRDEGEKG